jgi:hypothetical protein
MPTIAECRVCRCPDAEVIDAFNSDCEVVKCKRCGEYSISEEAKSAIANRPGFDVLQLSAAIREAYERIHERTRVSTETIDALLSNSPGKFDIPTKARKLISAIARKSNSPGSVVTLHMHRGVKSSII